MSENKISTKNVIRIAGSMVAWSMGAGFATGQEVLQFFSSYGYKSFGVVLINLIGFILIGYFLMKAGFKHKHNKKFNHFKYFCGNKLGTFYTWLVTITLIFLIPVLIAGAGSTLNQYYGLNHYIGSAIMAILVLLAYLIGFERMISIISYLGLIMIAFLLIVGVSTLITDVSNFFNIEHYELSLTPYQPTPNWLISGLLYLGLTLFPGSTYYTKLGINASSTYEIKYGALLGGIMLVLSIGIISTAILLNGDATAGLDIPVLYLAAKISYILGTIFSVVLLLGIFSSCSAMMWSVCSRFTFKTRKGNHILAVIIAVFAYLVSLFSFGQLISTIYPIIGYIGLTFIAFVIYKSVKKV